MLPSKDTIIISFHSVPLTDEVKKCDLDGRLLTQHCTHGQVTQQAIENYTSNNSHAVIDTMNKLSKQMYEYCVVTLPEMLAAENLGRKSKSG